MYIKKDGQFDILNWFAIAWANRVVKNENTKLVDKYRPIALFKRYSQTVHKLLQVIPPESLSNNIGTDEQANGKKVVWRMHQTTFDKQNCTVWSKKTP